jgi:serine/threonine protein kinase
MFKERYQSIGLEERMMLDFIKKCLVIDPYSRVTCDQAMLHPWFLNSENPMLSDHMDNRRETMVIAFQPSIPPIKKASQQPSTPTA